MALLRNPQGDISSTKVFAWAFGFLALITAICGIIFKVTMDVELPAALYTFVGGLAGGGLLNVIAKRFAINTKNDTTVNTDENTEE